MESPTRLWKMPSAVLYSVFDVSQAAPTVHLQFKDKLGMVKRSLYPFRRDGLDAWGASCLASA
jgi:hypothetical protein